MAAYAPDQVIYAGSLSKLALPALRLGYIAAPEPVIDALAHMVSLVDGMGSTLTEDATADLMDRGELRRHARKMLNIYATRRMQFAEALVEALGERATFSSPDGGLAFWLRFADEADLDKIEARGPELGLTFAPSRSYMARDDAPRGLRVGFASLTPAEARRAIAALRTALD
jgi:GntR family transcriptional regulator/MocR family aminotransferase